MSVELVIVTPSGEAYRGEVERVVLPGSEGDFGVLEGHERFLCSLRTGEIQLTNGLRSLLSRRPLYACEIQGVRHDTGNKLGYIRAVIYFALRRPELADAVRRYLRSADATVAEEP